MRVLFALLLAGCALQGAPETQTLVLAGLQEPVEILRDRWGVPHIYARNQHDLFFAQGYIAAKDRLFQIDLWRRAGTGKLAEVLGPAALPRDRIARLVRFRGNWKAEWESYAPDTYQIVVAFTDGINAYIRSLGGKRPYEFRRAGYDPGLWRPEDCLARLAGLAMTRNLTRELQRALDIARHGIPTIERLFPPEPSVPLQIPLGLDLRDFSADLLADYNAALGTVSITPQEGSNNWAIASARSATGRPIHASDPHRAMMLPSLRKTVHLVAPGWNVIGAGEPALPGVALGHNDSIAFGFTIAGIDQQDLYVEQLHPRDNLRYRYQGQWRKMERLVEYVSVKGRSPAPIELLFTHHGPVIAANYSRRRAYALRWVGSEPGAAGYLAALSVARARNWNEFLAALSRWKVPSQNFVYADTAGNIGWQVAGLTPVRPNWSGLLPVPGAEGKYEWAGFRKLEELPRSFNPSSGFLATANHNILPPGYSIPLGYEWSPDFRYQRIREVLSENRKFTVQDSQNLQLDVLSLPARRFQQVLRRWRPAPGSVEAAMRDRLLQWDATLRADSAEAAIYEFWIASLHGALFGAELGGRVGMPQILTELERADHSAALAAALQQALAQLDKRLGPQRDAWRWGSLHLLRFEHPLKDPRLQLPAAPRPGDAFTVNATSGSDFRQTSGASYRHVLDLADWDRSVMTNVPGESGDPESPHYADLLEPFLRGEYHPMPFSRKAVEAAAAERFLLTPAP